MQAWNLHQKGWRGCDIAEALGVSHAAVSQWLRRAREQGSDALKAALRSGTPRLTPEQKARVPGLLLRGAQAYGFSGDLWTTARVADVIAREVGVSYHRDHVRKLLRACGWSYQKPARRASQRDEKAIATWKAAWPEEKKRAEAEGRTILFLDESAFYLLPAVVRTWAPAGKTPVLMAPLTRDHLSVVSAVTPEGKLSLQVQKEAFNGEKVVGFLRHLLQHLPGKLLVVWDGARIHCCAEVQQFVALDTEERMRFLHFPAYAPEVDPDELVWRYLKHVELRNLTSYRLDQLQHRLQEATKRLRQRVDVLRNFVTHALTA